MDSPRVAIRATRPTRCFCRKVPNSYAWSSKMNSHIFSIISSEQAHLQSVANEQVEQDVMDDADGEEDEEGALEVVTWEERTQLMAEVM